MKVCPTTGKTCYPDVDTAAKDGALGVYLCPVCESWHRTRGENSPPARRLAQAVQESERQREAFLSSPLAANLDPEVVERLFRLREAS